MISHKIAETQAPGDDSNKNIFESPKSNLREPAIIEISDDFLSSQIPWIKLFILLVLSFGAGVTLGFLMLIAILILI